MRGGVLVVRLERVGERSYRRDEGALEALVVLGALDRELRLVREACEQSELAVVELTVADRRGQGGDAIALELQRRDDDARDAHLGRDRHGLDLLRLEDERLRALEPRVGQVTREAPATGGVVLACEPERCAGDELVRLSLLLDPE